MIMIPRLRLLALLAALFAAALAGCSAQQKKPPVSPAGGQTKADPKAILTPGDDLDEYTAVTIADPLEPLNRATFWVNHQLYRFLLRPVSKGYETVVPQPLRRGILNVFQNVEFPVRFVNDSLQGRFDRAGKETGRFVVNSVVGVGGFGRPADHIPALADVPPASTGQTFAKWGIGHGAYIVLPLLGPSSLRDTVGLAGDYVMNPVTWVGIFYGHWAWTIPVSVTDTVSIMPDKFGQYDAASQNSLDRYLALRSSYAQARAEAAKK